MTEQESNKKTSNSSTSFLNKVVQAVSDDQNEKQKKVPNSSAKKPKTALIKTILRALMTKRSIIAIFATFVFLFLSLSQRYMLN